MPTDLAAVAVRLHVPAGRWSSDPARIPAAVWVAASTVAVADGAVTRKLARLLNDGGLPRRPGLVLISEDLDDADVWSRAADLGAAEIFFLPDDMARIADRLHDRVNRAARAVVAAHRSADPSLPNVIERLAVLIES